MLDAINGEPMRCFLSSTTTFCGAALKKNSLVLPSRSTSILSPVWSTRGDNTCSLFTSTGSRPNDTTHTTPSSLTDSSRCRRDTSLLTILISHALSLRQQKARESDKVRKRAFGATDSNAPDSKTTSQEFSGEESQSRSITHRPIKTLVFSIGYSS